MWISIMRLKTDQGRRSLTLEIAVDFINCLGDQLVSTFSVVCFKESIDILDQLFPFVFVDFDEGIGHP